MDRAQLISMLSRGGRARMSDEPVAPRQGMDPALLELLSRQPSRQPTAQEMDKHARLQALDAFPVPEQPLNEEQLAELDARKEALYPVDMGQEVRMLEDPRLADVSGTKPVVLPSEAAMAGEPEAVTKHNIEMLDRLRQSGEIGDADYDAAFESEIQADQKRKQDWARQQLERNKR